MIDEYGHHWKKTDQKWGDETHRHFAVMVLRDGKLRPSGLVMMMDSDFTGCPIFEQVDCQQ